MSHAYDLIVIGGGVLGTAHAYHALQHGKRVLLLERSGKPAGATVQNFGQVVPSGQSFDRWLDYGRAGLECYKALSSETDITFRQTGSYYLASTLGEMAVAEATAAKHEAVGYPVQVLSKSELKQRLPHIQDGYNHGGLFYPEDGNVEPREMIHRLHDYLREQRGLDIRYLTTAIDISANGHVSVRDNHGHTHHAERAVVCSGSDVQTLFPTELQRADLQLVKLQMMLLNKQRTVKLPGNILTGLTIRRYAAFKSVPETAQLEPQSADLQYLTERGVHVLFKQAWDGSVILGDTHDYTAASTPEGLDWQSDMVLNRALIAEAQRILALDDWSLQSTWVGKYTQTRGGNLLQHEVLPGVHLCMGIGGKGMTCSFGVAEEAVRGWYG